MKSIKVEEIKDISNNKESNKVGFTNAKEKKRSYSIDYIEIMCNIREIDLLRK